MLQRRALLGLLAGGAGAASVGTTALADARAPDGGAQPPTLLVAGPEQSEAADWARLLVPALSGSPTMAGPLRLRFVGGRDGVTGANQFEARWPDGDGDALLLPGSAALAWLVGDSRVRFDATRLIPLFASVSTGLLMARALGGGRVGEAPMRVGCAGAVEPGLAGLLGLNLLGAAAVATRVSTDCGEAIRSGEADAVFLQGGNVQDLRREAEALGFRPVFAVGVGEGAGDRDPACPDVPVFHEVLRESGSRGAAHVNPDLLAAWHAVAAASVLDVALALPGLSVASGVARWRRACAQSLTSRLVQDRATAQGFHLLDAAASAAIMERAAADGPAQLALRRWLAGHLDWRPG